jgi:rhodanese-related sulfurtransferase
VDVREPDEHEQFHIGGILVPLTELGEKYRLIPKDRSVVLYCKVGIRSMIAIQRLETKYGYGNLINLAGGIDRWLAEFPE